MDLASFSGLYRTKTDEELLLLAVEQSDLTPEARMALKSELDLRRIAFVADVSPVDKPGRSKLALTEGNYPTQQTQVGVFIEEVLRFYSRNRWTFLRLIVPAVVIGTVVFLSSGHEILRIERHLPRGAAILQYGRELLEIGALRWGNFVISWVAFCISFGAISVATEEIVSGYSPSVAESFDVTCQRLGPLLRLSLLLFVLLVVAMALLLALEVILFGVLRPQPFATRLSSYAAFGLAVFLLSRSGLAIPALMLDDHTVNRSLLISYKFTRRKWTILTILLFKSIVGGYVAGMLPFWLARWIPTTVNLPSWFPWLLWIVSAALVTVIEPIMFIGLTLLYLKTTADSAAVESQAAACEL